MTLGIEDLAALLGAEARELRRLLTLLKEQEGALLRGDAAALAGLGGLEEAFVRRLGLLEDQRRSLVERLAGDLGVPPPLTLSALLRLLPEPPPRLIALRVELRDLLGRLSALNKRNGFLAERSVGYLDRLLTHLLAVLAPATTPTYARDGRAGRAAPVLRLVDRRA